MFLRQSGKFDGQIINTMTESATPQPVDEYIGQFRILTRLAIGGMAEIFLAQLDGLGGLHRKVVIKRILPQYADDPLFVDMFLREARIIAQLNHPNVVHIHELGLEDGQYYLVLDYIHGTTVRELQVLAHQKNEALTVDIALSIVAQIARGLHAAHELVGPDGEFLGIVHRDVTPHNMMCMLSGDMKLLDFGIAKATEHLDEATYSGDLKGKFSYMSPEQALQEPLDRRSDLFSLGIVLWELLTGRRLFKRDSHVKMINAVLNEDIPQPSLYEPTLDLNLESIVLKALAREPADRYQTTEAFQQALVDYAQRANMDISPGRLKAFVERVAGDHLREEQAKIQAEYTHSSTVRRRPSSYTPSAQNADISTEAATVVERPNGELSQVTASHAAPLDTDPTVDTTDDHTDEQTQSIIIRPLIGVLVVILIISTIISYNMRRNKIIQWTDKSNAVKIAWAPTVETKVLEEELKPLESYLGRTLGRPVVIVFGKSYKDTARMLVERKADFAVLPPLMYLRTLDEHKKVKPVAIKEYDGSTTSDGLLIVSTRKVYKTFKDLKGLRFCLTDKNSTSGYFLPHAYIKQQGFDPKTFMGKIHMSGDHLQVIRDLLDGQCDVAATYNGALFAADRLNIPVSQIRTMAITGHIPQDVVCSHEDVPEKLRGNMRAALLRLDPLRYYSQPHLGATQRITGFRTIQKDLHFKTLQMALKTIEANQSDANARKTPPKKKDTPKEDVPK